MTESELLERLRARRALPPADERQRIRLDAGASLRDVAREIGVSATSVIRWERGASPRRHTAAYARLLDELRRLVPEMREPDLGRAQDSRDVYNDGNDTAA